MTSSVLALGCWMCHAPRVAKTKIPELIAVSPMSLTCPRCNAKPGEVCDSFDHEFELIHLERIEVAAALDKAAKKARAQ